MPLRFYGRERELSWLADGFSQVQSDCSRMYVVTGRRRIGKTTLVNEAFQLAQAPYLFLFINKVQTVKTNIRTFWADNAQKLGLANVDVNFSSFADLFSFLLDCAQKTPLVLLIDEFQNLESVEPSFFGELQRLWDARRKQTKMFLILSGSVASAMREITGNITAPLYGRKSASLNLTAFPTTVVKQILNDYNPNWTADDLLTLHMLTGGVAKYIEVLMEANATHTQAMLELALSPASYFMTEGETLMRTEFKSDFAIYFEVLSLIARGKTKRREIISALAPLDATGQLRKLEEYFHLIEREVPFGTAENNRNYRVVLADDFLSFWFRFITPNRHLIERGAASRLIELVNAELPDYTGRRVLESYFRKELWESGNYTEIGRWWDRKGENEIDIIALNPFDKEILFLEVKRNAKKFDEEALKRKGYYFLTQTPKYQKFKPVFGCKSLADLRS